MKIINIGYKEILVDIALGRKNIYRRYSSTKWCFMDDDGDWIPSTLQDKLERAYQEFIKGETHVDNMS